MQTSTGYNRKIGKGVFLASLIVLLYWASIAYFIPDVYKIAFMGAIFELLWLPMIILLGVLPIISFIHLVKSKFRLGSISFYSLLISIGTIIIVVLR